MQERKQHQWSGWPGAWCLNCGCADPMEVAMAQNWVNVYPGPDNEPITEWDSEEHRQWYEKTNICHASLPPGANSTIVSTKTSATHDNDSEKQEAGIYTEKEIKNLIELIEEMRTFLFFLHGSGGKHLELDNEKDEKERWNLIEEADKILYTHIEKKGLQVLKKIFGYVPKEE